MESILKKYLKYTDINTLIYLLIYLIPLFYLDYYGILFLVAAISITNFIELKNGNKNDELPGLFHSKVGRLLLIFSILLGYVVTYLFHYGYLDKGLELSGIKFIPTYTIFYYCLIPIIWFLIYDKGKLKQYFSFSFDKLIYTLIICLPIVVLNSTYVVLGISGMNNYPKHVLVQNIFQFFITASLAEELFFRGYVYAMLKKMLKKPVAQILSSAFFATWHLSLFMTLFNNFSVLTLMNLIGIFILGIANTKIFDYSKSLIPCIIFHALVNGALLNSLLLFKM